MLCRIFCFVLFFASLNCVAQTSVGIGIYPTGTETGIGFRSAKDTRFAFDARITKANWFTNINASSFINEMSFIYRASFLEKVRLHLGLGFRAEWAHNNNMFGAVLPIGVEAFPFPFQNAGLFFEAAPFYVINEAGTFHAGIRTVAGCVFYFPKKVKKAGDEKL